MSLNETLLMNHKSVRKFASQQVDPKLLERIIRCAQHAATSEFIQSYTIINITDRKMVQTIYDEVTSQKTFLNAPVFMIFCADVNRLIRAGQMNDKPAPAEYMQYTETFLMASMDTAIAAQNAVVAAELNGLGCTYIGGIRNNLSKVIELLKLPQGVYPLFGMAMGYPMENTEKVAKPRLPLEVVYKENTYDISADEAAIREYDEIIRNYYISRTGGERSETWSQQMADFMQKPQRPQLKEVLADQGFKLI